MRAIEYILPAVDYLKFDTFCYISPLSTRAITYSPDSYSFKVFTNVVHDDLLSYEIFKFFSMIPGEYCHLYDEN